MSIPEVSNFLTGMSYRAWGGLKQMSYGNGLTERLSYNTRLQMSQYQVDQGTATLLGYEYRYDLDRPTNTAVANDGRVRYARDLTQSSSAMDRSYSYDHVGRLVSGTSGSEARGEAGTPSGPYKQGYGYNEFGNLNHRDGRQGYAGPGAQAIFYDPTYSNDRNGNWTYNAAGQVVDTRLSPPANDPQYQWNAAGQMSLSRAVDGSGAVAMALDLSYDGDGQNGRRVETDYNSSGVVTAVTTTYYIRSSVLSGQVVNEMNASGGGKKAYLYANGQKVGRQNYNTNTINTYWISEDAAVLTYVETDSSTAISSRVQMDPLGVQTALGSPQPPPGGTTNPQGFYGYPGNAGNGCRLDGAPFPCDWLARLVNSGSAVPCPNGGCGLNPARTKDGTIIPGVFERFNPTPGDNSQFTTIGHSLVRIWIGDKLLGESQEEFGDSSPSLFDLLVEARFLVDNPSRQLPKAKPLAELLQRLPTLPYPNQPIWCQSAVIEAMKRAWARTGNGTVGNEAGFVLNGTPSNYQIVDTKSGNTRNEQQMEIFPDTFLLFHVHPNSDSVYPSTPENNARHDKNYGDTLISDRFQARRPPRTILFLVGHRTGLSLYDPRVGRPVIVRQNLDWLDLKKPCG